MDSRASQFHFVIFPLMAQGHMIPMVDTAKLLAQHGMIVTVITTTANAARFAAVISHAKESGPEIQVIELQLPLKEAGLPEGCESFDVLPSQDMRINLLTAASKLQQPVETLFEELTPWSSCIISDMYLPWTSDIATKFQIPRISFNVYSCLTNLCMHNLKKSNVLKSFATETEYAIVPGAPDFIQVNRAQLPGYMIPHMDEYNNQVQAAEMVANGVVIANSFEDLEPYASAVCSRTYSMNCLRSNILHASSVVRGKWQILVRFTMKL